MVKTVVAEALADAGILTRDIVAVKAHGTGTRDNDLSEGRGLAKVFGAQMPPVVSLKGAIGHGLGAAGAVETALWLSCLEEGEMPRRSVFRNRSGDRFCAVVGKSSARRALIFSPFSIRGTCTSYVINKE
jgi:3-oxoacyl-(acyl-carrier-protein) synthase